MQPLHNSQLKFELFYNRKQKFVNIFVLYYKMLCNTNLFIYLITLQSYYKIHGDKVKVKC